ncbi:MAG: hypothetical protein HDS96_01445 [Bacteroidales bacterium]|nr:hypothetical protein [Bacteroidales bacterium]
MNKLKLLMALAPALAAAPSLFAQQHLTDAQIEAKAASTKFIYIDGKNVNADSLRAVVTQFYYDQFRNSQDPDMPYFMFMSKGANMMLGVGGGVRLRAFYDWNGAMPTNAFSPYTIPIPADASASRRFNTTPSGTYFNLRLIGHNDVIGAYGLYIEADFTGYNGRDLKLKKSYAVVRDFTVGYASSTFSDAAAQPAIVDAAGPNNKFSNTNVLVRYMPCFKNKWYVAASIETPSTAIDVSRGGVKAASNWLPDAAAFVQYEWAKGQHVRLSGIVRSLSYMTTANDLHHNLAGWGVQASAVGKPEQHLTLYATVNYGHGYAGLGGDLLHGQYDLVSNPENPTELYAPAAMGWCAGVQYNFRPNLFATLAASQTHYMPRDGVAPNEYKHGTMACANVFWSIIPRLTVAAEYDWGMRRNFSGEHKAASRVNVSAMFTF